MKYVSAQKKKNMLLKQNHYLKMYGYETGFIKYFMNKCNI